MLQKTETGVVIKQDWAPDRISRAYREPRDLTTQADEFVQSLLLPGPRVSEREPRPVELSPWIERLMRLGR